MDKEELKAAIDRLRERRSTIPAMREYRPQKGKGTTVGKAQPLDLMSTFGNLIKTEEDQPPYV